MDEEQVRRIIREELSNLIGLDKYTFQKDLQIFNARNIQLGRTNGTKIGTAVDQKLGFWGDTPVIQQDTSISAGAFVTNSGTAVNAGSTFSGYTVGQIVEILKLIGIIA